MNFQNLYQLNIKDKVALIDPKNKVCLKVSKRIADNIENQDVRDKILPIWKRQASLQKEMEEKKKIQTRNYCPSSSSPLLSASCSASSCRKLLPLCGNALVVLQSVPVVHHR